MDREELIAELQRLEKYGFYIIEEAYQLAETVDLSELTFKPVSAAALLISQKAVEMKFDQKPLALIGATKPLEQRHS